jgi:hypothetical protein
VSAVIEELASPDGAYKAEIRRGANGNFRIVLRRWLAEDVPGHGRVASGWSEVRTGVSLTDSIEIARDLARELLRHHGAH